MSDSKLSPEIEKLHSEACQSGLSFYIDPETGYQVQTRIEHLARGSCCESGCRHCPYGFRRTENAQSQSEDTQLDLLKRDPK